MMKVLLIVPLFSGCSIDSPLIDAHPSIKKILIESPPQRIVYYGDVDKAGEKFALRCIKQMQKKPYKNYKFNETTTLSSNVQSNTSNVDNESIFVDLTEKK